MLKKYWKNLQVVTSRGRSELWLVHQPARMRLTLSESNNSGAKTKTGVASEKGGNAKNTLKLGMASEDAACAHLFMHACVWL